MIGTIALHGGNAPRPASPVTIRPATRADFPAIWPMFHAIVGKGTTYAYAPETTKEEAEAIWFLADRRVYVAEVDGKVAGTFYLRPNQYGLAGHVANGGFMVSPDHAGQGVGRAMGAFALAEAKRLGFHAIQFNMVVETNEISINLWKSLGFEIIGRIPDAYQHAEKGLVGAYIMYKKL